MFRKIKDKALSFDRFGNHVNFLLPGGAATHQTFLGFAMTIILYTTIAFYGSLKFIKLYYYWETDIMTSVESNYFSDDYIFSSDNGM